MRRRLLVPNRGHSTVDPGHGTEPAHDRKRYERGQRPYHRDDGQTGAVMHPACAADYALHYAHNGIESAARAMAVR